MKRILIAISVVACAAVLFSSCKEDSTSVSQGKASVVGVVFDISSGVTLSGVTVEVQSVTLAPTSPVVTGADGKFEFQFELDSTASATLIFTKASYRDTTIVVTLRSGVVTTLNNVRLNPRSVIVGGGGVGGGSGLAQTIAFLGATPQLITVYGVGGQETAVLGFEARDSLGLPIDAAHAVAMTFTILSGPGGGEYISPPTVTTNAIGRSFTTLNSGIRSGAVQVEARATVGTRVITSAPVRVVINAGYPHQSHFTIAPELRNFPTLGVVGNRDRIHVLVGDIYSNPVVQNTGVYFFSRAGVIQASVFTNLDGEGIADLISGNPFPIGPNANPRDGCHYVVASTVGSGGTIVKDSVRLVWSGPASISNVNPATFDIPDGGSQDFTFRVSDYLGNPLAAGTAITVVATVPPPPDPGATVNQVLLSFGLQGTITLNDFLDPGPGSTDFGFRLSDGTPIIVNRATPVSVSITVAGPNGNAYVTLNGIVH
jgi:hypothetical protein